MKQFETSNGDNKSSLFFYFFHDQCQVSLEIGGSYKRGYRQYIGKTPLRETLAAALSFSSLHYLNHLSHDFRDFRDSHDSQSLPVYSVIDPFCGSGTILQEFYSYRENDFPYYQKKRNHQFLSPM